MNNQRNVTIVDYADVLKESYENANSVIIGYKPSDDGSFDYSSQIYNALNINGDNINLPSGSFHIVDEKGNPIIIDGLHYYTVGEGNKILHSTGFDITGGGVGYSTIGEYKRTKTASLNSHHANGTLDSYDAKTYEGVQNDGIQVVYLRYVGTDGGNTVQI